MSMAVTRYRTQAFSNSHAKNTVGHSICMCFDEELKYLWGLKPEGWHLSKKVICHEMPSPNKLTVAFSESIHSVMPKPVFTESGISLPSSCPLLQINKAFVGFLSSSVNASCFAVCLFPQSRDLECSWCVNSFIWPSLK